MEDRMTDGMRVRLRRDASWMAVGVARGWNGFWADSTPCTVPAGTVGTVHRKRYAGDEAHPALMWAVDWDGVPSEAKNEKGDPLFCGLGNDGKLPDYLEVNHD